MKKLVRVNVLGNVTEVIVDADSDVHAALIAGTLVESLKHGKLNDFTKLDTATQLAFDLMAKNIKVSVSDLP